MAKYVTVQVTKKEPPVEPAGEGERCRRCQSFIPAAHLEASLRVCPECGYHFVMSAPARIAQLGDRGTVHFVAQGLRAGDPLEFVDLRPYPERLSQAQIETGLTEGLAAVECEMGGKPTALGVMDFRFLGGSMGSVVGETFRRLAESAVSRKTPLVIVAASGGARMQEGLYSLMQMAKTVVSVQILGEAGLPFISVLTHPTTGGVLASFATIADIIIAEPGAVMRFAGARVIEQTTREKLPPDFGSSESQLAHGQVDMVVDRRQLKDTLVRCLGFLSDSGSDGHAGR